MVSIVLGTSHTYYSICLPIGVQQFMVVHQLKLSAMICCLGALKGTFVPFETEVEILKGMKWKRMLKILISITAVADLSSVHSCSRSVMISWNFLCLWVMSVSHYEIDSVYT